MAEQSKTKRKYSPTTVRPDSFRRAKLAAALINESITEFISSASDARAGKILKVHGLENIKA